MGEDENGAFVRAGYAFTALSKMCIRDRYRSEHRYTKRGDTERADRNTKDSVKVRINDIKARRVADGKAPVRTRAKSNKKGRVVSR